MIAPLLALSFAGNSHSPATGFRGGLRDASALRADFNAARGRVRIVMLVSPTCPACVSGADAIQKEVVGRLSDNRLAAFSVFVPMLESDRKGSAVEASTKMLGAGIPSYWDGGRKLGTAYARTVKLPGGNEVAWDVFFLYGPDAVWRASPPKPVFWMHQLACDDRCLDPAKFRAAVAEELRKPRFELLVFAGCPNSQTMRTRLRAALKRLGRPARIATVDLLKLPADDPRRGYPSPTILVDGRDLFGLKPNPSGTTACRVYPGGTPSVDEIAAGVRAELAGG